MTDWNIQGRAHACQACGKSFVDKERYHTLLFDERHNFNRSDICESCWQKQYSDGAKEKKGFVSYWQGVYEAPPPPSDPIQKETAESLLRKLIELNDSKYVPAGYILAVMLERKRILKVKEQLVRDGQRVFIYELPRTGEVFTIVDPNLQLNQLEAVQHDVAQLLEHGLNPPPVPVAGASDGALALVSGAAESQTPGSEPAPQQEGPADAAPELSSTGAPEHP